MPKKPKYEDLIICKQPRIEDITNAFHEFTPDEKDETSAGLCAAIRKRSEIEAQKKSANSEFKSELETQEAEIERLTGLVEEGGENREVECIVALDPTNKKKHYYNKETLEKVRELPMSQDDFQMQIEFERDHGEAEVDAEVEE